MADPLQLTSELIDLRRRHAGVFENSTLKFYKGCRLKILVVADNFLYFNDSDFGLSELVATLRGMSTSHYPVTVDLAHRDTASADELVGASANFTFQYDKLKKYDQIWIFAADYPSRDESFNKPVSQPIRKSERLAIKKFMDEGGGVFATGDHEDLGVTVGGYIPRVRSMRRWFFPSEGPQSEPIAPHGSDATRHDTNREGNDPGWSFNDQSDDVPQTIIPHYLGNGSVRSVHPVLCAPNGPIKVLPDHAHEGQCEVPSDVGASYEIDGTTFQEYPDGPNGQPLAPVLAATATMIPGAEAPPKDPVPGGSFGVIAAWDGHRAGTYGRIVVDATWHHFININLIGDRKLGPPDMAVPKSMGFLHSASGRAHYERIKTYFRNIANWMTPKSKRRCFFIRDIWWATQQGWFRENYRHDELVFTGQLVFDLSRLIGPCDQFQLIYEFAEEAKWLPPWVPLIDPSFELPEKFRKTMEENRMLDLQALASDVSAMVVGSIAEQMLRIKLSVDELEKKFGDDEADIPELSKAADIGLKRGLKAADQLLVSKSDLLREFSKLNVTAK